MANRQEPKPICRRTFLGLTAAALAARGQEPLRQWKERVHPMDLLARRNELSALQGATAWINSPGLTSGSLKGKVVLVQFWTFTCINWLRTLPCIRTWSGAYRDSGLVVIGVHTPEFPFEGSLANVRRAAEDLKVDYPIAVDSDYAIWRGFSNQYWPALYLFDARGQVRHRQFGEGGYVESERTIQALLQEAGAEGTDREIVEVNGAGIEAAADWADLRSPENYVGYGRGEGFASPGGAVPGRPRAYSLPQQLRLNHWGLEGHWTIQQGSIALNQPHGRLGYCFHGRDLHLVMGPPMGNSAVRFRVRLDGGPPKAAHGADVDEDGNGVAAVQRLYQLIRQPRPIVDRVLEIEFLDPGVEAFAFTFG